MIGLDTNVVVRLIARDDAAQTSRAAAFLRDRCTADSPGFISHVVLSEVSWVLRDVFRYSRDMIAAVMEALLRTPNLRLEDEALVAEALSSYRTGRADFADCLIGLIARRAGCRTSMTFDQGAAALPEFTAL